MISLGSLTFAALVTMGTCHVPVFRDGMLQMVPGRRSEFDGLDRFGSFGSLDEMWRFGPGFGGRFAAPWMRTSNPWWRTDEPRVPQIPQSTDLNNPTQWFSGDDDIQQNTLVDPWIQYQQLQNSINQGTSTDTVTTTNNNNAAGGQAPGSGVNTPWNTAGQQLANSGLVPNTDSQFPTVGPLGPFQPNMNMAGPQWNSRFQRFPNNGLPLNVNNGIGPFGGMPFTGNNGMMPFNANIGAMPFNGNIAGGMPFNGNIAGDIPFNGNIGMMPLNANNGGMPFNGNNGGMPFNGNNGGMPFNGNIGGSPVSGNVQGLPNNGMEFANNGMEFANNGMEFANTGNV